MRKRRGLEPAMPTRSASPPREPRGDTSAFARLLRTEQELLESHAFQHVENNAFLDLITEEGRDERVELYGGDHEGYFRFPAASLINHAREFAQEHGRRPTIVYMCDDNDTISAVLY